jgi:hypothetical protein
MFFRKILFYLILVIIPAALNAQVTTSTVTGVVKDPNGIGLDGASIQVVHEPSGTKYETISGKGGAFTLIGLRIGGPYKFEASFVGLKTIIIEGFSLTLGDPYEIVAGFVDATAGMQQAVVTASRKQLVERSGASTTINSTQLATLPSFNRSISDFISLTPQSNGGSSFAGRSGYYNNLKIDGANLNNSFGLNTNPLPGGGSSPISLDAFDQVSVNIAPVDVRQSGFTGAGINAVTKSGTNELKGSAFFFYRDHTFSGLKSGDVKLERTAVASSKKSIGMTLGGPIIKDKVFFFMNGEYEMNSGTRITNWNPLGTPGAVGNISNTPLDSMAKLSNFLKEKYGYETGAYSNFPVAKRDNYKYLLKVDWNINNRHKLTAKYNDFVSTEDPSSINSSSIIGGGGFSLPGSTNLISSLPNGRIGNQSMVFENSVYGFKRIVRSGTLELNSNFRRFSNSLLFTASRIRDTRITNSSPFPFVEIFDGGATPRNYMSFGYEPYSYNNDVINKVWNITDNFTYYAGNHTLTGGFSYEHQMVGNMFMPGAQSYYIYGSLNDFVTDQAPLYYSYAYSMVAGQKAVYSAEVKYGQAALYLQDEIRVNDKMKVTLGLRAERPVFTEKALENPAITALTFPDKNGNLKHYNGQWPNARILLSPRAGLRYDVLGDKSFIIRASTGIFSGLAPFVWLTNMPTNSGMYQNSVALRNSNPDEAALLNNIRFNPDLDAYSSLFPPVAGTTIPSNIVLIDQNFKFPMIFRTNIGVEKYLGKGYRFTFDGIISKDINAVRMRNANLKDPTGVLNGPDNRPRYMSNAAVDRSIYPNISSAIVLENTNKGYSYALTAQLSKDFTKGLYGSVAYTYTGAKDVGGNSGSQAFQIWNSTATINGANSMELHPSASLARHRVISMLSYRLEYANHASTTISLIYEGAPSGNITYRVNGDINGDGINQDLLYIPNKAADLNFEAYSQNVNGVTYNFTAEQQAAAFEQFINNTPYLNKNRGKYAERNGAVAPWINDISARIMQEFFIKRKNGGRHTLQLTADFLNFGNLLNKYWSIRQSTTTTQPIAFRSYNANGEPVYRMQQTGGKLFTQPYQTIYGSTWSMQLGVRYIF